MKKHCFCVVLFAFLAAAIPVRGQSPQHDGIQHLSFDAQRTRDDRATVETNHSNTLRGIAAIVHALSDDIANDSGVDTAPVQPSNGGSPRGGGEPRAPVMTPISVSGWNRDVIVEQDATYLHFADFAEPIDTHYGYALYEKGLDYSTKGLPQGGAFVSLLDGTTRVQLQPYDAPNALFLDAVDTTGTLTFDSSEQKEYDRLSVFATSSFTFSESFGPVTITFVDDTFVDLTYNAYDWYFNVTDNAINDLGRVKLQGGFEDTSSGNPRIYQTTFDLVALGLSDKPVKSLTFGVASYTHSDRTTCIFAVSGVTPQVVGDMNCDGQLTPDDVMPFALALIAPDAYDASYPTCNAQLADVSQDGVVDGADIQAFIDALLPPS